jgi:hypothetical protein
MNREELDYEIELFQLNEALDAAKAAFQADPNEETLAAKMEAAQAANAHVRKMREAREAANPGIAAPSVNAEVKGN